MALRKITTLLGTGLLAVLAAGCSNTPTEPEPTATPEPLSTTISTAPSEPTEPSTAIAEGNCPEAQTVETSNPDDLSYGFSLIAHCWDSVHDRTMTAAALRATPLMTDELTARTVEPERNAAQNMFNQAYKSQAYSQATAELAPTELNAQDTEDISTRVYWVDWDWHGRDGTTATGGHAIFTVSMTKDGDTWRIADYSTTGFQETRN